MHLLLKTIESPCKYLLISGLFSLLDQIKWTKMEHSCSVIFFDETSLPIIRYKSEAICLVIKNIYGITMQVVDWISKQAGKIADNFNNYKFYVKHTPERIDSSTILSLSVFASREEEAVVPCLFRWHRIKNGLVTEVDEFKGNTFICEPSDVGCTIQAEVTSTDPQYAGTAVLKYGPVELDILLRETIENAISVGEAKFSVDLYHGEVSKQCIFTITDDFIHIAHCNSNAQYRFYYCLGEPLFNTYPKDPTKISIVFSQKFQNETLKFLMDLFKDVSLSKEEKARHELTINIKFLNRKNKDELLFIMKGFNAKKELKNTTIINKIEKLEIDSSNLNYVLQIQSLKADLLRLFNITKRQQEEKHTYYEETCKLQQEIEDIISSYTKLIEGKFKNREQFEESFAEFEQRKDQAITHKYQRIEEENARLREFIRENMDKDFKDIQINYNKFETLQRNPSNPFLKKKEPFAELTKQDNYEQILNNLSGQEEMLLEDQAEHVKLNQERQQLQQKLNKSLQKIEKLQEQLDKYEKGSKSVVIDSNQVNQSMSKHNMSALEISTSKVIEEKLTLQKKYAMLKEEYRKLKAAYQQKERAKHPGQLMKELREDSLLLNNRNQNPEFNLEANKEISRLREVISHIEKEKENLRLKSQLLALELKKEKDEHERTKQKLEKKMLELNEEISVTRRSNDALNRSQHLSMEMDDYNCKQNEILKEQVGFLESENVRLSKMCEKYKGEYKRLKEIAKLNSPI